MKKIEKSIEFGGRKLTLQTGRLAEQANSAVLASYGETVVLATVATSRPKEDLGYFPLTVEYQEKLYAGGRIKGSRWVKREGRPTDDEILTARLIDRSVRPLFPKEYKNEVQIIITVLSVDLENSPDIVAALATSAALTASTIPWEGPVATLRVGMKDGTYFTNPQESELSSSNLDLVVTTTADAVVMIEAGAKEVPEKEMLGAIEYGQKESGKLIDFLSEFAKAVGRDKEHLPLVKKDLALEKKVKKLVGESLKGLIAEVAVKSEGLGEFDALKRAAMAEFGKEDASTVAQICEDLFKAEVRNLILKGKRPDGRKFDEVRPISVEAGILPRTHGSALFQRGQTQALTITTLGTPSLGQLIESAEGEEEKRYIHHYSFPPFSTGETGRVGYPSRREIGHGALAERALEPVIPGEETFPYAIRVVSEVLSSNGSTSMASVCGSTLSLMDAGVPISAPVSGIAMGLIVEDPKKYAVLTDIIGLEDFNGDMDFKVAGTEKGITALQLDVKTLKLTAAILGAALEEAKKARAKILNEMLSVLSKSRAKVSTYAPKIKVIKIAPDKIGEVIGPGGRMIKKIIAETGAQVEVEDDGTVNISGLGDESVQKAYDWVEGMTKEVAPGEIYEGTVKRIQPFGAFVEILPGKEGLVHVSDMAEGFVKSPEEVVKIGDKVKVRVKEIDELKRINLSMRMDPATDKKREAQGRGFERGGGRPRRRFDDRRPRPEGRGGPHFPKSRLMEPKKRFNR